MNRPKYQPAARDRKPRAKATAEAPKRFRCGIGVRKRWQAK